MSWPQFNDQMIKDVEQILKSGKVNQWTNDTVKKFEQKFASYFKCNYAVAVFNGTVALELCIKTLGLKEGDEIIIVQIAGLIARRIVCEVSKSQPLIQGQRIGMIRFGSRVDVYFNNRKTLVKLGQNVVAGESLLASD